MALAYLYGPLGWFGGQPVRNELISDMGRIAHLPIANKADSDWQYGIIVPGIAPFVGAAIAAWFMHGFFGIN